MKPSPHLAFCRFRYLSMKITDDGLDGVGALMFLQMFFKIGLVYVHAILMMMVKVVYSRSDPCSRGGAHGI